MTRVHNPVIFDMDGVLVDSEPLHKEADVATFRTVGLEVPVPVLQEFAGFGADRFFSGVLDRYGKKADPLQLRAVKDRLLAEILRERAPSVPGSRELVDHFLEQGRSLALASSSSRMIVQIVLERLDLTSAFHVIVSGDDVTSGKPAPDIFLLAAKRLNVATENCVVIEDSGAGCCAARAAGMTCIGFRNPRSGNQDLSCAHRIVDRLDELIGEI